MDFKDENGINIKTTHRGEIKEKCCEPSTISSFTWTSTSTVPVAIVTDIQSLTRCWLSSIDQPYCRWQPWGAMSKPYCLQTDQRHAQDGEISSTWRWALAAAGRPLQYTAGAGTGRVRLGGGEMERLGHRGIKTWRWRRQQSMASLVDSCSDVVYIHERAERARALGWNASYRISNHVAAHRRSLVVSMLVPGL